MCEIQIKGFCVCLGAREVGGSDSNCSGMAVGAGKIIVSVAKSAMPAPSSAAMGGSADKDEVSSSLVRVTQMPNVSKALVLVFLGGNKLIKSVGNFVAMPAFQHAVRPHHVNSSAFNKNGTIQASSTSAIRLNASMTSSSSHMSAVTNSSITNSSQKALLLTNSSQKLQSGGVKELGSYSVKCLDHAAACKLVKTKDKKTFGSGHDVCSLSSLLPLFPLLPLLSIALARPLNVCGMVCCEMVCCEKSVWCCITIVNKRALGGSLSE